MKFQGISNTPKNHQTGSPRPPKVSKMRSKVVPKIIKFMKKSEMGNLMKTLLFTILLIGWDIRNLWIFHPNVSKNHTCNPNLFFYASNNRKYEKVVQHGLQTGDPKSIKNQQNSVLGPSRVPLSASVTHWIAKWSQNGAQGSPNGAKMVIQGP